MFLKESSLDAIFDIIQDRFIFILIKSFILSLCITLSAYIIIELFLSTLTAIVLGILINICFLFFFNNCLFKNSNHIYFKYKLLGNKSRFFDNLNEYIKSLSESDYIWLVKSVVKNFDTKLHAGSKEIYNRSSVKIIKATPSFIHTNIDILCFKFDDLNLFFFPDFMLFNKNDNFSFIRYESLIIEYSEKSFHEYEYIPEDSKILGYTWLHPKKDGMPDKRFGKNPRVPIMLYSELIFSLHYDISIHIQVSNIRNAYKFSSYIGKYAEHYTYERYRKKKVHSTHKKSSANKNRDSSDTNSFNDIINNENAWAYKVLGIPVTADKIEIKKAYRNLVKIYHPDKYLFKRRNDNKMGEEKIKEINKAYETLKNIRNYS